MNPIFAHTPLARIPHLANFFGSRNSLLIIKWRKQILLPNLFQNVDAIILELLCSFQESTFIWLRNKGQEKFENWELIGGSCSLSCSGQIVKRKKQATKWVQLHLSGKTIQQRNQKKRLLCHMHCAKG